MSTITTRWAVRLAARKALLVKAHKSVAYWARRASSAHGGQMLREARARQAIRQRQVVQAQTVLARHGTVAQVSAKGLALIAGFEGFRSAPYQDIVGVWTTGYGETRGVGSHTPPITRTAALLRLRDRVNRDYLAPVLKTAHDAGLHLTQHQADALASLVYNLGPGILAPDHTMGAAIRAGNRRQIADAFLIYDRAGGRPVEGLTRRRTIERALYLHG